MTFAPNRWSALIGATLVLLAGVSTPALAFDPKSRAPVNVSGKGLALRGYDPVAYFASGGPIKGDGHFQSTFDGATYVFASAANKDAFDKEPAKYAPQYGGFCAWAAANGYKADADPRAWSIVNGRLYVNYNASVHRSWSASPSRYIKDGDAKWDGVKNQLPK